MGTGHVKLPTSVSIIPDNQFEDNAAVKSIYIPKSVTKIGSEAFHNATELKFVKFEAGSSLAIIGNKAFRNCKSLCAINIPQGVTIKKNAFNGGKYDEERFEAGKKIDLCSSQFPSLAPSDHFSQKPSFTASENPSFAPTAWPYEIDSTGHVKLPTSVSIIPDNQFEDNAAVK